MFKIRLAAVYPPVYPMYQDLLDAKIGKTSALGSLGSALIARYDNLVYRNYSSDSRFSERDFFDANHLNSEGVTKLTNILKEDFNL